MIHSGKKPFQCTFKSCCKYFREKGNLMSHFKKHHKEEKKEASAIKENSLNSTSSNNESISNGDGLINFLYVHEADKNNNSNLFDLNELNCYNYSDSQDDCN